MVPAHLEGAQPSVALAVPPAPQLLKPGNAQIPESHKVRYDLPEVRAGSPNRRKSKTSCYFIANGHERSYVRASQVMLRRPNVGRGGVVHEFDAFDDQAQAALRRGLSVPFGQRRTACARFAILRQGCPRSIYSLHALNRTKPGGDLREVAFENRAEGAELLPPSHLDLRCKPPGFADQQDFSVTVQVEQKRFALTKAMLGVIEIGETRCELLPQCLCRFGGTRSRRRSDLWSVRLEPPRNCLQRSGLNSVIRLDRWPPGLPELCHGIHTDLNAIRRRRRGAGRRSDSRCEQNACTRMKWHKVAAAAKAAPRQRRAAVASWWPTPVHGVNSHELIVSFQALYQLRKVP